MEYARTVVSVIRARSVVVHKQTLVLAKNSQIKKCSITTPWEGAGRVAVHLTHPRAPHRGWASYHQVT